MYTGIGVAIPGLWQSLGALFSYAPGSASNPTPTFTRAGTATYKDINGNRQIAAINALRDGHYIGGVRTTLLEAARTNHFVNSGTPATQTSPSLTTGTYTLWMEGTGSIAVAGATATITGAGTATAGSNVTFVVTVAGTVTYTVTGSPTLAQAEDGAFASSYIPTAAASVTRATDIMTVPLAYVGDATVYVKAINLGTHQITAHYVGLGSALTDPRAVLFHSSGNLLTGYENNGTVTAAAPAAAATVALGDTLEGRMVISSASFLVGASVNGAAETTNAVAGIANPNAWSAAVVAINGFGGSTGFAAFQSVKVAAGTKSLAEMRAL